MKKYLLPGDSNSDAAFVASHSCTDSNSIEQKPLDAYVEIIRKRFPKYIYAEETKCNILRRIYSVLFRKEHYNEYCFLEYNKSCESYSLSFFKSDWKDFEKIETDFLYNSISFAVFKEDLETIMNCIV